MYSREWASSMGDFSPHFPEIALSTYSSCRVRRSSQSLKSSGTERIPMKASVVGSGYVGTTLAACLADLGHDVVAVDIDEETVARLDAGETPLHEPGLDPLVSAHAGDQFTTTTDTEPSPIPTSPFWPSRRPPTRTATTSWSSGRRSFPTSSRRNSSRPSSDVVSMCLRTDVTNRTAETTVQLRFESARTTRDFRVTRRRRCRGRHPRTGVRGRSETRPPPPSCFGSLRL